MDICDYCTSDGEHCPPARCDKARYRAWKENPTEARRRGVAQPIDWNVRAMPAAKGKEGKA